jgi:hypothetical protein
MRRDERMVKRRLRIGEEDEIRLWVVFVRLYGRKRGVKGKDAWF